MTNVKVVQPTNRQSKDIMSPLSLPGIQKPLYQTFSQLKKIEKFIFLPTCPTEQALKISNIQRVKFSADDTCILTYFFFFFK